jgi:pimeloyl-ACP methyl ester carboxylesterase
MSSTEVSLDLPQGRIDALVGGDGRTIVVLPHEIGRCGWGAFHDRLAAHYRVVALSLPGFDKSERPAWLRNVTDLSALVGFALDKLEVVPCALFGLGFGGWVAAEIAARSPERVSSLVLHAPYGIKPPEGEVLDQFLFSATEFIERGCPAPLSWRDFLGHQESAVDLFEKNREMTMRVGWKPYLYDPALPHLLKQSKIPALIVRASNDGIVPASVADAYRSLFISAQVVDLKGGHFLEVEAPDLLADAALTYLDSIGYRSNISRRTSVNG